MVEKQYTILAVAVSAFLALAVCSRYIIRWFRRFLPWGEQPVTLLFAYSSRPSNRIHVLIAILYFGANLIYIGLAKDIKGAANRSALLGLANLIPTYTFAKMNPVIDRIGLTQDSLLILHHWLASISFSELYFHGMHSLLTLGLTNNVLTALFVLSTALGLSLIGLQMPFLARSQIFSWLSSVLHWLHIICAIAMLPMIAIHLGWPYAIGPAAGWLSSRILSWAWTGYLIYQGRSIALYTTHNRSSATASSFKRLQIQLKRPRAFVPGQYFLYDQSRLSFLAYLGLRIPQKVFISEVITVRQRNFPIFEVPGPAARGVMLEHKPYIEGPYGGLDFPAFTKWSKFFVLVAEDLGLGRQLFLLQEILQQQYSQPLKLFLIWIIRRKRHVDSLVNFYSWSMTEKQGNIEYKVRRSQRIQLFIKIYGASLRVGVKAGNSNIYIDTNPQRYEHDCIPLIRDGIGWNGRGLTEGDFGSTSLSVCGSPRMIGGFDVLKNDWKALQNLKVLDTAVLD